LSSSNILLCFFFYIFFPALQVSGDVLSAIAGGDWRRSERGVNGGLFF
jgi:hypothetical protein